MRTNEGASFHVPGEMLEPDKPQSCAGGHRAVVIEVAEGNGGKTYKKWCSRCLSIVSPDAKTSLL